MSRYFLYSCESNRAFWMTNDSFHLFIAFTLYYDQCFAKIYWICLGLFLPRTGWPLLVEDSKRSIIDVDDVIGLCLLLKLLNLLSLLSKFKKLDDRWAMFVKHPNEVITGTSSFQVFLFQVHWNDNYYKSCWFSLLCVWQMPIMSLIPESCLVSHCQYTIKYNA